MLDRFDDATIRLGICTDDDTRDLMDQSLGSPSNLSNRKQLPMWSYPVNTKVAGTVGNGPDQNIKDLGIYGSSSNVHIFNNAYWFEPLEKRDDLEVATGGRIIRPQEIGTAVISVNSHRQEEELEIRLLDALYIPDFHTSLVSAIRFEDVEVCEDAWDRCLRKGRKDGPIVATLEIINDSKIISKRPPQRLMAAAAEVIHQGDLSHARVAAMRYIPARESQDIEDLSETEGARDQSNDDSVRLGDASRVFDVASNLVEELDNRGPTRPDSRSSPDRSNREQPSERSGPSSREEDEAKLWHRRLSHPDVEAMRHLEFTSIRKSLLRPKASILRYICPRKGH